MIYLIEKYINNLSIDDIHNYAKKNNIIITNNEASFIYSYIKNNYKDILVNKKEIDLKLIKNSVSTNTYNIICKLINDYSYIIKR